VSERGACTYQELAEWLGVSTMTVRRDVDELAAEQLVLKVLGGVQSAGAPRSWYETDLEGRRAAQAAEKRAIAACAVGLVAERATLFLDGSTTCLELAAQLARDRSGLTITTNSLLVALAAGRTGQHSVIVLGGEYDHDTASCVGPASEAFAHQFHVDLALMSTKGFVPGEGTFESSLANFRIKQGIAQHCRALALLVDHTKFGQRALCKVLDYAQIQTVIADAAASEKDLRKLRRDGKHVLVAGPAAADARRSGACPSPT
jgi:DeoR/GlpR family transcriptional regulator of sugar metabolism